MKREIFKAVYQGGIVGVPRDAAGRLPKSLYMALLRHEKSLWRPMGRDTRELTRYLYQSIRNR